MKRLAVLALALLMVLATTWALAAGSPSTTSGDGSSERTGAALAPVGEQPIPDYSEKYKDNEELLRKDYGISEDDIKGKARLFESVSVFQTAEPKESGTEQLVSNDIKTFDKGSSNFVLYLVYRGDNDELIRRQVGYRWADDGSLIAIINDPELAKIVKDHWVRYDLIGWEE